jgi:hypothetical protein
MDSSERFQANMNILKVEWSLLVTNCERKRVPTFVENNKKIKNERKKKVQQSIKPFRFL